MLSKLLRSGRKQRPPSSLPPGLRVYAIGDVHGRADLLDELIAMIDADDAARPPAETSLVFLGDLVDRGAESAAVIERVRALSAERPRVHLLLGNHEEIMLGALAGDPAAIKLFCRIGGRETLLSYGIAAEAYDRADYDGIAAMLADAVPAAHQAFLAGAEDLIQIGDYAFVHAGIRPGVPLAEQKPADLRWIRDTFLDHKRPHEKRIVHGHTIVAEVVETDVRIGIDTGAYASGRLTALGLEADATWLLQTEATVAPDMR